MLNRNILWVVCVCLTASVVAVGQAQYLIQLPGPASTSGQFYPYPAAGNPLSPISTSAFGPVGLSQVIAKPDGTKFYLVGAPGANSLQAVDPTFINFHNVTGIGTEIVRAAVVTPDGKYLLVGTNADVLHIIDTTVDIADANSTLTLPGVPDFTTTQPVCATCWIAVSRDSSTAYVLTNFAGASQVTKINLLTKQKVNLQLFLTGDANAIALSPLGLLYVTAANEIFEVNPATLTLTAGGNIQLAFSPGLLRFTSDGSIAYSVNKTPNIGGHSILQLTVANHLVNYWPSSFNPGTPAPVIDDVLVTSNATAFAISSATQTLYDVTPTPLTVTTPSVLGTLAAQPSLVSAVSAAAISDELPSPKFLYLLVNNGAEYLYRVDLATNTINTSTVAALNSGLIDFVSVPPQTGVASFLLFNNNQTLTAGATSAPLIARVLDTTGRPMYNVAVAFSVDPASGIVIATPAQNTNADGYVQTTVTMPSAPGAYNVTLTAGGVVTTFNLFIPGAGGGGGGGGPTQVTIVSGDGQLVDALTPTTDPNDPLTLLVTDTAGNPLPNVPVGFTLTQGTGNIYGSSIATDQNGLATTLFSPFFTAGTGAQFQTFLITATTQFGSVVFTVTEIPITQNQGAVNINLLAPTIDSNNTVTVGQGEVVANAVQATIYSNISTGTPLPGVGIRLTELDGFTPSVAASCQGPTLSDKTGVASCNVLAKCQPAGTIPKSFPVVFRVGDNKNFFGSIEVTPGHSTVLNLTSGNNQTGRTGVTLATPLVATVTDGCQTPASGVGVTWSVTQGSATLTNIKSISDSSGRVSTQVTFGQVPGPVRVQVTLGATQIVFNLTGQVVLSGISLVSGGNQSVVAGQAFPQPLQFVVKDTGNNPVQGVVVNFSVTSGSAGVNPASQQTNQQGAVFTTVTAGTVAGTIVITATAGSVSTTATLSAVTAGPVLTVASFVNADSGAPGLVPCGRGTVTGPGITNITGTVSGFSPLSPLPYTLGGFSLTISGIAAPLESVSNVNGVQSATFQTPCEVQPGSATVIAQSNGTSTISGVPVFQAQPGIHSAVGPTGKPYGFVICSNGTITPTNFANRGDNCYMVVTGLGQTTPPAATNVVGVANQNVNVQVVVGVNNAGVPILSAQYLVGWNGFYLIGFQIPPDTATGPDRSLAVATILSTGEVKYGNYVFLPGIN